MDYLTSMLSSGIYWLLEAAVLSGRWPGAGPAPSPDHSTLKEDLVREEGAQ